MSKWQSVTFKFDIFEPLKPPLKAALMALEAIEAILEAFLDLVKAFMLDLLNPLRSMVALLLAAIRALINQIKSSGISILLIHPDFSQIDFGSVLNSVYGGYPEFETRVISKFYDTSDIFRPQYPPGSSVSMLIFYIGADSPGDLMGLLFSLLALIKHPVTLSGLPAPIAVKVLPINKGGDTISQFKNLFEPSLDQALSVEWRMPQSSSGASSYGFMNQLVAFYDAFRFPNFIIERHGPFPQDKGDKQLDQNGEILQIKTNSSNLGNIVDAIISKYNFPEVNSLVALREDDGTVHHIFNSKQAIQFGGDGTAKTSKPVGAVTSALASDTDLISGIATGTYRFLDKDPTLIPGRTYYYRIRAFFGDATNYVLFTKPDIDLAKNVGVVRAENYQILKTAPKLTLGKSSTIVRAYVPKDININEQAFNVYKDIYDGIIAGILLNFDLPFSSTKDIFKREQKTGWGTLSNIGGQIAAAKLTTVSSIIENEQLIEQRLKSIGGYFPIMVQSNNVKDSIIVKAVARRMANSVVDKIFSDSTLAGLLSDKWNSGVKETVEGILYESRGWLLPAMAGGITPEFLVRIDNYLELEKKLEKSDNISVTGSLILSPLPVTGSSPPAVLEQDRQDLADFLRMALSFMGASSGYLSWYSVTVGDLFPFLAPFMYDFENFLMAFLKAVESAMKELTDIIATLIQKIKALEQALDTILSILNILDIKIVVSVLSASSPNGSSNTLVQHLISSINKPSYSPYGLYSGIVLVAGGPGEGSVAAVEAIRFLLGIRD